MKTDCKNKYILLFALTYMVSYLTRVNYGAVISAMETSTGFPKPDLSLAVTGSFITYGVGQIVSGMLGDRFSPKKLVLIGLGLTTAMNLILPFCGAPWLMTAVWSVNGFAQALIWPPIVRLMVALYSGDTYSKGIVRISWGSCIGSILVYLTAPLLISWVSWKGVFFAACGCGLGMMVLWQAACPDIQGATRSKVEVGQTGNGKFFSPVFCTVLLALVLVGALRDGVTTWTPSLISESFQLGDGAGILSGAVLPIFGLVCYELVSALYRKQLKNPLVCAGVMYALGVISSGLLAVLLGRSPVGTVLSVAVLNGSMHGANLMLTGMVPSFYGKTGRVSTVAGVLNAFVYVGSAASTYGIALLAEGLGWSAVVLVWLALAALGTGVCLSFAKPWQKSVEP